MAGLLAVFVALSALFASEDRIALLGGACTAVFLLLLLLARSHRVAAAGSLGTGLLLIIVVTSVVTGHGIRDLSFPGFAFIMLLANLVLDSKSARLASFATWALAVAAALAEYLGFFQTEFSSSTTIVSVVVIASVYLGITLTARGLVRSYREGVRDALTQELGYRHIFNATTEGIVLLDPETRRIIDVNRSGISMFGFSRDELCSRSIQQLAGNHQSLKGIEGLIERGRKGDPTLFDWTATSKDGTQVAVEVSLRPAFVGDRDVLLAVFRDISETRLLHDKLRESEKLQAVGQLAGGIAHDFNNQLTGILANATLLSDKLQDERLAKCADVIVRCCKRSSDLTSQLLAFARRGKHQNVNVDVTDLISEVVALLEHTIDKRIELQSVLPETSLKVLGDPTLLQNALLNLGLNARDAMPQGGVLKFEASRQLIEVTRTGISATLSHGDYVRIVVSDTGAGMDETTRKRIFEPFFTTKERGNGMGLAAVYGAIESHRGDISVKSERGAGTSFTLLLPMSEHQHESLSFKAVAKPNRFEGLRVLVAEDEEDVAISTVTLLHELGCSIVLCDDGQSALDLFARDPHAFDIVLVDHMMPRLSGREALKKMQSLRPTMPSVITSGFSNSAVVEDTDQAFLFLPKPFGQEQLSSILQRALSGSQDKPRDEAPSVEFAVQLPERLP